MGLSTHDPSENHNSIESINNNISLDDLQNMELIETLDGEPYPFQPENNLNIDSLEEIAFEDEDEGDDFNIDILG